MSLPPTSPVNTVYTQPSVSNSVQRDTVSIGADGVTRVLVQRRDSGGNVLETIQLTLPAAGGQVTDLAGRVYGTVADGAFTTSIATILAQADSAVAGWAAQGKFNR